MAGTRLHDFHRGNCWVWPLVLADRPLLNGARRTLRSAASGVRLDFERVVPWRSHDPKVDRRWAARDLRRRHYTGKTERSISLNSGSRVVATSGFGTSRQVNQVSLGFSCRGKGRPTWLQVLRLVTQRGHRKGSPRAVWAITGVLIARRPYTSPRQASPRRAGWYKATRLYFGPSPRTLSLHST